MPDFKNATHKILQWIIDNPKRFWGGVVLCYSTFLTTLSYLENLPNAVILVLVFASIAIFITLTGILFLIEERWTSSKRTRAIRNGAKIIFEDKDGLWVVNIIEGWTGSVPMQESLFTTEENRLRIKNAYVNGKIILAETNLSNEHPEDPVSFMTMEKREFIRWLVSREEIPIPKIWYEKSH